MNLFSNGVDVGRRRQAFKAALAAPHIARLPGAFSPLIARSIEEAGFEGVYVSGAVIAADLALPDIGLTTLTEVAHRARQIARVTDLGVLVDADTGFGEPMSAARTVAELRTPVWPDATLKTKSTPNVAGTWTAKKSCAQT